MNIVNKILFKNPGIKNFFLLFLTSYQTTSVLHLEFFIILGMDTWLFIHISLVQKVTCDFQLLWMKSVAIYQKKKIHKII